MNLQQFLQNLEQIQTNINGTQKDYELGLECSKFHEVVLGFVNEGSLSFEDKIAGLRTSVEIYGNVRTRFPTTHERADALGHEIFMACARLVLGVEFHRLQENEEPRSSFNATIVVTANKLKGTNSGNMFMGLQCCMVNYWTHATLVAMMKGDDVDEQKALDFIQLGEPPDLVKLRVEMLIEGVCENYALNVCNWCVKSPLFEQDVFIRQTQLLLMHKFGHVNEFHNQCWQLDSKTAVQVVTHCLCYAGIQTSAQPCYEMSCATARKVLNSLLEKEQRISACLILAQTFLLQDWMNPTKKSCTEELLRLWLRVQRHVEDDSQVFLHSVQKVADVATNPSQNVLLVQVLYNEFGWEFLQFCSEQCLVALKRDRHKLDSARIVRDDNEADQAADSLARTCIQVAALFEHHHHMWLANILTSFYLEPNEKMYYLLERKLKGRTCVGLPPSDQPQIPKGVQDATYKEILDMVGILRPATLSMRLGWIDLKKVLLFHLEEAGLRYVPQKNGFREVESTGPPGPRCAKMGQKHPKPQPTTSTPTNTNTPTIEQPTVQIQHQAPGGIVVQNGGMETDSLSENQIVSKQQDSVIPMETDSIPTETVQIGGESQSEQKDQSEQKTTVQQESSNLEGSTVGEEIPPPAGGNDTAQNDCKDVAMDTTKEVPMEVDIDSNKPTAESNTAKQDETTVQNKEISATESQQTSQELPVKSPEDTNEQLTSVEEKDKTEGVEPSALKEHTEESKNTKHAESSAETSQSEDQEASKSTESATAESSDQTTDTVKSESEKLTAEDTNTNSITDTPEHNAKTTEGPSDDSVNSGSTDNDSKQQQQQQPSLVPYDNEDSSSSTEAQLTAQTEAAASTSESTSANKEVSQGEVHKQEEDKSAESADKQERKEENNETKAEVEHNGAISDEAKDASENVQDKSEGSCLDSESKTSESETAKEEEVQNAEEEKDQQAEKGSSEIADNEKSQEQDTAAEDATQPKEATESQCEAHRSEEKMQVEQNEPVQAQIPAEEKRVAGESSAQPETEGLPNTDTSSEEGKVLPVTEVMAGSEGTPMPAPPSGTTNDSIVTPQEGSAPAPSTQPELKELVETSPEVAVPAPVETIPGSQKEEGESSATTSRQNSEVEDIPLDRLVINPNRKFRCQYCKKWFGTMAQRRRHQEWVCSDKPAPISKPKPVVSASDITLYPCPKCEKKFQLKSSVARHLRMNHKEPTDAVLARSQSGAPAPPPVESLYPCPKCDKKFQIKSSVARHIRMHHNKEESSDQVMDRCNLPKGIGVKKCAVNVQRLSSSMLNQYNCVLRTVRRRRLSGKLIQRKGSTGRRESMGSDGMDPADTILLGGMESGVQGEHLDDIFSQVLSHDVMASDMPLTFTEEEIQQAEAASFAMAASITQIGHDGQHVITQPHHVIPGQLSTQLQQHLLQQVSQGQQATTLTQLQTPQQHRLLQQKLAPHITQALNAKEVVKTQGMTVVRVNLPAGATSVAGAVTTATVPVPVLKAAAAVMTTRVQPVPVTTSQPLQTATASANAPQVGTAASTPSVPADSTVTLLRDDTPLPELGSTVGSTLRTLTKEGSNLGSLDSHEAEAIDTLSSTLGMQRPTVVSVVSTESAQGYEALRTRLHSTSTSMTTFQPIDPPTKAPLSTSTPKPKPKRKKKTEGKSIIGTDLANSSTAPRDREPILIDFINDPDELAKRIIEMHKEEVDRPGHEDYKKLPLDDLVMSSASTPTNTTNSTASPNRSSPSSSVSGHTPEPPDELEDECAQLPGADSPGLPSRPPPRSESSSPMSNPQTSSHETQSSSSLVPPTVSDPQQQQSSNNVVSDVVHSDFSLVSHSDFHIAPGQFRMALEEAPPPIMAPVEGSNGHALVSGVVAPQSSDSVVPNGVNVHASMQNGDQSPSVAHSSVPYLDSTKTEGVNNQPSGATHLPHVASILQAGPQMGGPLHNMSISPGTPSDQQPPVDSSGSAQPPAPIFIVPALPSGYHSAPQSHSKTDVRAVVPDRFKAQEAREREERVRKRIAAGLPAEDPATPTGAHSFLLSPSASMSGGRPSSAMSSSMMSDGSGVFSSDVSLSRSSSMFSLDSSTAGSIGPLEPGALKIEIPNIDNPHPDTVSVHSTNSYGNEDTSDTSSNPKKKAQRRRGSLADPNERHFCKFCEQDMGTRKEKIKHQIKCAANKDAGKHTCEECGLSLSNSYSLHRHLKSQHKEYYLRRKEERLRKREEQVLRKQEMENERKREIAQKELERKQRRDEKLRDKQMQSQLRRDELERKREEKAQEKKSHESNMTEEEKQQKEEERREKNRLKYKLYMEKKRARREVEQQSSAESITSNPGGGSNPGTPNQITNLHPGFVQPLSVQIPIVEGEVPSSVTGNYTALKDPLLLPHQPLSHHGNTIATSHTGGSVTTTTSMEQPRLSLPASLLHPTQDEVTHAMVSQNSNNPGPEHAEQQPQHLPAAQVSAQQQLAQVQQTVHLDAPPVIVTQQIDAVQAQVSAANSLPQVQQVVHQTVEAHNPHPQQQGDAAVQGDAIQQALATSSVMLEDQENQLQTVNPEMLHQTSVESTTTENLNTSNDSGIAGDGESQLLNHTLDLTAEADNTPLVEPRLKMITHKQVQIMRLVKVYCGTCNTVFGGRLALKSHYRNSPGCNADDPFTEDIKYHCRLCNEQFDMKDRCRRHALKECAYKEEAHLDKNFPCEHCDKRFVSAASLNGHMLAKHVVAKWRTGEGKPRSGSKIISTRRPGFYPLPDSVHTSSTPVVATSTVTMQTSEVSPSPADPAKKKKKKKKKPEGAEGQPAQGDPNAQGDTINIKLPTGQELDVNSILDMLQGQEGGVVTIPQLGEGDGIHLSNQPGIVYLQTTVTNEAGEVTQQMIPVQTSALQHQIQSSQQQQSSTTTATTTQQLQTSTAGQQISFLGYQASVDSSLGQPPTFTITVPASASQHSDQGEAAHHLAQPVNAAQLLQQQQQLQEQLIREQQQLQKQLQEQQQQLQQQLTQQHQISMQYDVDQSSQDAVGVKTEDETDSKSFQKHLMEPQHHHGVGHLLIDQPPQQQPLNLVTTSMQHSSAEHDPSGIATLQQPNIDSKQQLTAEPLNLVTSSQQHEQQPLNLATTTSLHGQATMQQQQAAQQPQSSEQQQVMHEMQPATVPQQQQQQQQQYYMNASAQQQPAMVSQHSVQSTDGDQNVDTTQPSANLMNPIDQAAAAAALVGPDGVPLTGDDPGIAPQDPGLYPPPPPYPYTTTDGQAVVTQQIGPDGQPIITDQVQISDPAAMDPQQIQPLIQLSMAAEQAEQLQQQEEAAAALQQQQQQHTTPVSTPHTPIITSAAKLPPRSSRKPQIVDGKRVTTYMNAMMYQIDIFTCQGCGTEFESKESVDGHFHLCPGAVKDSKLSTKFQCFHCDDTFPTRVGCRKHQIEICLPSLGISPDDLTTPQWTCHICSKGFFNKRWLKKHLKEKHENAPFDEEQNLTSTQQQQQQQAVQQQVVSSTEGLLHDQQMMLVNPEQTGTPQPDAGQNSNDPPVQIIQQSELNAHQVNQLLQQLNVSNVPVVAPVLGEEEPQPVVAPPEPQPIPPTTQTDIDEQEQAIAGGVSGLLMLQQPIVLNPNPAELAAAQAAAGAQQWQQTSQPSTPQPWQATQSAQSGPQKAEKPATPWEAAFEQHLQQRQQPMTAQHDHLKKARTASAATDKHVPQSAGSDQWQQRTTTSVSDAQQQGVSWQSMGTTDLQNTQQPQQQDQQQWQQQANWQQEPTAQQQQQPGWQPQDGSTWSSEQDQQWQQQQSQTDNVPVTTSGQQRAVSNQGAVSNWQPGQQANWQQQWQQGTQPPQAQTPIPDPPPPSVGEVVAKCEACKRGFTSHDLLVYHEKYNCTAKFGSANRTDDRTCRYCKATFHLKVALKVHMTKHHSHSEENKGENLRPSSNESAQSYEELAALDGLLEISPDLLPQGEEATETKKKSKKRSRRNKGEPAPSYDNPNRINLMISLERKTLHHVQVLNSSSAREAWQYQCIYCQKVLDQIMSVHSHVLSQHPEMYKKVKIKKGVIQDSREPYWHTRCSTDLMPEYQASPGSKIKVKKEEGGAKSKLEPKHEGVVHGSRGRTGVISTSSASTLMPPPPIPASATTRGPGLNLQFNQLPVSGVATGAQGQSIGGTHPPLSVHEQKELDDLIRSNYDLLGHQQSGEQQMMQPPVTHVNQTAHQFVPPVTSHAGQHAPFSHSAPIQGGLTAEQQHQLELQEAEQLVAAAEQLHAQQHFHPQQVPQTQGALASAAPTQIMGGNHQKPVYSHAGGQSNNPTFDPLTGHIGGSVTETPGSALYVCRLCNIEQRFEQEFSLKCHLKLVHGQDPEVSSSVERPSSGAGELPDLQASHKHNGLDTEDLDGPSPAKLPKLADVDAVDTKTGAGSRRRGARSRTPTAISPGGENHEGLDCGNSRRSPRAKVQKQLSDDASRDKDSGAVSTENIRTGRLRNRKISDSCSKPTTVTTDSQQQQPASKKTAKSSTVAIAATETLATAAADDDNTSISAATNGRNASSKKNTRIGRCATKSSKV